MINYKFLENLIHTPRWAGKRVIFPESVSDHVWGMNALAIEFCNGGFEFHHELLRELIYRITIHDIGESLYCDIPRNFKYSSKELHEHIDKAESELLYKSLPSCLVEDINTAKCKDPNEDLTGFIVALFDAIQAGIKMRSEILLGNKFFESEIQNSIGLLIYYRDEWEKVMKHDKEVHVSLLYERDDYILDYINRYIEYLKYWDADE